MNEMIRLDIQDLEHAEMAVIRFYKKQLEGYLDLKKEAEKLSWSDANYDGFVDSMNAVGAELQRALQSLSDGREVYIITELLELGRKYLENEGKFPSV